MKTPIQTDTAAAAVVPGLVTRPLDAELGGEPVAIAIQRWADTRRKPMEEDR